MEDRIIDELHRLREKHYEETKDLSFEELAERINKKADEFQKLIDKTKKDVACSVKVAHTI